MVQTQRSAVQNAQEQIVALGSLLDGLAGGRSGTEVHQILLDRFDEPQHDSRLDRMELGRQEFASTWSALQRGSALPAGAWEQVILPVVVALSTPKTHKIHLELATVNWLTAKAAVEAVPGHPDEVAAALAAVPVVVSAPISGPPAAWTPAAPLRTATIADDGLPVDDERRPGRRKLVWALVSLLAIALATAGTLVLLARRAPQEQARVEQPAAVFTTVPTPGATAVVVVPSAEPSPLPTALPTAGPQPSPANTVQPTPSPVWTGSAPPTPPSPPQGLTAIAATEQSVTLTWSPPSNGGTGGVAYYRILRDGSPSGWTRQTSTVVSGLSSGTGYTFVVIACNEAGQQSGPSNPVTVITATPPPVPSPSASTVEAPSEPPSPSAEPSPTEVEPSPSEEDPPTEPVEATN